MIKQTLTLVVNEKAVEFVLNNEVKVDESDIMTVLNLKQDFIMFPGLNIMFRRDEILGAELTN